MKYNVVYDDGEVSSVTAFVSGKQLVASSDHPNFKVIVEYLKAKGADETKVIDLFDRSAGVARKFDSLSDRISVANGKLYVDHVVMDGELASTVVKFYDQGLEDFKPLVAFLDKVLTNPSEHSRKNLYGWLMKHQFTLHEDGDFIAYKGVDRKRIDNNEPIARYQYVSKTAGEGIVNGVWYDKGTHLPNNPGDVVEMPRDRVTSDSHVGCSVGLHAGNLRYAREFAGYGGTLMRVKINPRDVVSVPTDSSFEKMRVCRYRVLDKVGDSDTKAVAQHKVEMTTTKLPPKVDYSTMSYNDLRKVAASKGVSKGMGNNPTAGALIKALRDADYETMPFNKLRKLANKRGVTGLGSNPTRAALIKALES